MIMTVARSTLLVGGLIFLKHSNALINSRSSSNCGARSQRLTKTWSKSQIFAGDAQERSMVSAIDSDDVRLLKRSSENEQVCRLNDDDDDDDDDCSLPVLFSDAQIREILDSYKPGTFQPHFLFSNSHLQTIVGGLFRSSTLYWDNDRDNLFTVLSRIIASSATDECGDSFIKWDERERVTTKDGDFFDVDWKFSPAGSPTLGTVVLTHGLESSSDKDLPRDLATSYHIQGFDVAYINFRGCSGELNRTPGGYHLSFTDDLEYFLSLKKSKLEGPIFLSGFSLGACVIVNFLAEAKQSVFGKYNVVGAAVNSCPLDTTVTTDSLNGPENFFSFNVYGKDLLRKLKYKSKAQALNPSIDVPFDAEDVDRCETIRDLENTVICPVYGFRDAEDYYQRSSIAKKLDRVSVPLYVVNSQDDPFLPGDARPSSSFAKTSKFLFTNQGGHCGNVLHSGNTPLVKVGDDGRVLQSSWMPNEMARFIHHVAVSRLKT